MYILEFEFNHLLAQNPLHIKSLDSRQCGKKTSNVSSHTSSKNSSYNSYRYNTVYPTAYTVIMVGHVAYHKVDSSRQLCHTQRRKYF